ncbi:hypothetical protein FQ775_00650 [Nitratireductor mangrovi]|uniref:Uncharacterized protein n=1 Tax=Nitratireductor mangrovi TaxID=2599600 RepID=A0A5B8KTQ5_9HYPH|nr:hypothetical protein [Nitratireductor mangrovi]QDY98996.1 hypothetical protein FQ775_00650 [Nitratireductor mangrovi]
MNPVPAEAANNPSPTRRPLRSIAAVVAGLATVVVLSTGADALFHATGVFPPAGEPMIAAGDYALAFAYRSVFAVLGGYIVAWLAPSAPLRHALVLGLIGTAGATAGAVAMWGVGPGWYPVTLALTALPLTLLGAALANR